MALNASNKKALDKIRDLINWIAVLSNEELREGEGRKIEKDTANNIKMKLQEIAEAIK